VTGPLPLPEFACVAILRGLEPEDAVDVGGALVEEGFGILEVPLNRPRALESVEALARAFGGLAMIGVGTVLGPAQAAEAARAGARLTVSPNVDAAVIRAADAAGLWSLPGAATPTEALAALAAGANGIKAFPAEAIPPAAIAAWKAILPEGTQVLPVGGIAPESMAGYLRAGADGFGIGSALFKPGIGLGELRRRARGFRAAWEAASA
jgi:2-dehydro-3-deoxyphosphogalactonate aldolase